jgi:hypothetical protein
MTGGGLAIQALPVVTDVRQDSLQFIGIVLGGVLNGFKNADQFVQFLSHPPRVISQDMSPNRWVGSSYSSHISESVTNSIIEACLAVAVGKEIN